MRGKRNAGDQNPSKDHVKHRDINSLASKIDGGAIEYFSFSSLCNIPGLARFLSTEQISHLQENYDVYLAVFAPLMYVVALALSWLKLTLNALEYSATALYAAFLNAGGRATLVAKPENQHLSAMTRSMLVLDAIAKISLMLPAELILTSLFSFFHFTYVWLRSLWRSLTAIVKHIWHNVLAYTGLAVLALGGVALYGTLLQASWMPATILSLSAPLALVAILTLGVSLLAIKIIMSCQSRESNKSSSDFVNRAVARQSSLLEQTAGAAPFCSPPLLRTTCSGSAQHPGATEPGAHDSQGRAPARGSSASR